MYLKIKLFLQKHLFYRYISKNNVTYLKSKILLKHLLIILAIFILITTISLLNLGLNINEFGLNVFKNNLVNIFKFSEKSSYILGNENSNLWILSINYLWITIKYTLVGSFLGFIIALITSYITSKNNLKNFLRIPFSIIITFLRSIPELVFITIFTNSFNSYLVIVLVFFWFSWLWLHKYYLEMFNSLNYKEIYLLKKLGNNNFKIFFNYIWPRISNRIIAQFLYSFESNIRWSSILATLGLGGIGTLIYYGSYSSFRLSELGIPFVILFIFIVFLELFNFIFLNFILRNKSAFYTQKRYSNSVNKTKYICSWKFYFNLLLLLMPLILTIYILITIDYTSLNLYSSKNIFVSFFNPDWSVFNVLSKDINLNPFLQILQTILFSTFISLLSLILTITFLPLFSRLLFNKYYVLFNKIMITFLRIIPVIIFFFILNTLFFSPLTLLLLILTFHQITVLTKLFSEMIDKFNKNDYHNLKIQGYSKSKIYFLFLIPSIKHELISIFIFYLEINFRNLLTYSIYSQNELVLGSKISYFLNEKFLDLNKAFSYVWISTFTIISINLIKYLINNKLNKVKLWPLKSIKINFLDI
ncbi:ABC transporter permease subunit [Mycoplasmopsis meleagridis]|uniref:ABC transporter permease subunit n=1 Tax=Mycoplasmopsis meleagridis TaxID=29561 RepID=UPI00073D9E61|nr:ABC transporter permease subunit [Mycoplasmopsis meleagridis]KUH47279.1 hypothetical protein ASB56_02045 [Mycoplasmopsis meleagridis]